MARKPGSQSQATSRTPENNVQLPTSSVARSSPFVFISHDSRDADLAAAFDNLLTDASGGVIQTFRSSDQSGKAGIEYGENWYSTVAQRLADATDVVALLTPNSTGRPWILFEAGWAVGRLNTKVFGISIGLPLAKAIVGPFAQFQNCEANEDSLTGVVLQLIQRNPEARPREQAVRRQVAAFLEEIDPLIKQRVDGATTQEDVGSTAVTKLFEEVKVMFRDLSERVANQTQGRKRRSLHPAMVDELFISARRQGDLSTAWLFLSSLLREETPWLSEPAMDVYRAMRSGSVEKIQQAQEHFLHLMHMARHSRLFLGPAEDEDTYLFLRRLPMIIERQLEPSPLARARASKLRDVLTKARDAEVVPEPNAGKPDKQQK